MEVEKILWSGRPSQVINFRIYSISFLACWLILPILYAIWKWLDVRCTEYTLTSERLRVRCGIFDKTTDEIELYRIKDFTLEEPLFLRMFSLGTIVLITSDRTHPVFAMRAIPRADVVKEHIRKMVEGERERKRVREID